MVAAVMYVRLRLGKVGHHSLKSLRIRSRSATPWKTAAKYRFPASTCQCTCVWATRDRSRHRAIDRQSHFVVGEGGVACTRRSEPFERSGSLDVDRILLATARAGGDVLHRVCTHPDTQLLPTGVCQTGFDPSKWIERRTDVSPVMVAAGSMTCAGWLKGMSLRYVLTFLQTRGLQPHSTTATSYHSNLSMSELTTVSLRHERDTAPP